MSRSKPQAGCCGVCGCAVVQPTPIEKWTAVGELNGGAWDKPINESGWANGHEYATDGSLLQVRCPAHGGHGFPRAPVTDATVQQ